MASTWGKVLDQANIIKSAFQELEKACIKATLHDDFVPKEKHVRRLILCTHERADLSEEIYMHLSKRLETPDWIVVLKTLAVFHRLFRDGNPRFLGDLKWKGTIFPLSRFNDPTTPEAHVQSVFIRKYAAYLEEKILVFRALRMEFEKDPGLLKGLTVEESLVRLPKLQRQLDALIHCQTSAEAITNPVTALAFEMLLKDSFKLYRGLNDGVITLLETYFSLDKSVAVQALEIYRAFQRETSNIIAMYEMAKKKFTLELPDLKHAPTALVNSLEDYVKDYEESNRSDRGASRREDRVERSEHHSSSPRKVPSLIDGFDTPSNSGFGEPFGGSAAPPPAAAAQANLFDPFSDTQPSNSRPQSQASQYHLPAPQAASRQSSTPTLRPPPGSGNSTSSIGFVDPFAGPATGALVAAPSQSSYEEKALQIKAAYTPTLQPTTTSPTMSGAHATTTAPQQNYPKPNYNVSLTAPGMYGQPPPYGGYPVAAPYGVPPQYGAPPMAPYGMPPAQAHPQPQPNPFF